MYMNYITTTDLRTQSTQLVNSLKQGKKVSLVHRSQIIGEISPVKPETKTLTKEGIIKLKALAKKLNLPKLSYEEREKRYREHLTNKYGKNIS